MKSKIILLAILLITFTAHSQWTYKTISNGFDDPFKKAYTETNNSGWLAMQCGDLQTVIEYPDSITKKLLAIADFLSISDKITSIPFVKSNVAAYLSKTAYTNRLVDSSRNIVSDFIISMTDLRDNSYYLFSSELRKKMATYKIVTTSGTYYIGDRESFSYELTLEQESLNEMGSSWSMENFESIKELENYLHNSAVEKTIKYPLLYLHGAYFCDDIVNCDIVFTVGGVDRKYTVSANNSSDNKMLFFDDNLFSDKEFKSDFLGASKVRIRTTESYCDTEYYTFIMSGSTAAYNFLSK